MDIFSFIGEWAVPSGTAMLGQPMTEPEQAPELLSPDKNQFNIEETTWISYQILSW